MVGPTDGNTRIPRSLVVTPANGPDGVGRTVPESTAPPASQPLPGVPAGAQPDGLQTVPETISIKSGESLYIVATRHQVSMEQLRKLNPTLFAQENDTAGRPRGLDGGLVYPRRRGSSSSAGGSTPWPERSEREGRHGGEAVHRGRARRGPSLS